MNHLKTWREISRGNTDDVVLAVDFDATGRSEARFSDLVKNLKNAVTCWETLPQSLITEPDLTPDDFVEQWMGEVRSHGRPIRAVMGFCVGGVYAAALAERIGEWQEEMPLVILFDPEKASGITLYWQFHKVVGTMDAVLTPAEVAEAQEAGAEAERKHTDLQELGAELLTIFDRFGVIAFDRLGLDDQRRAELTETYRCFVSYLATAERIDPTGVWRNATAFSSTTPTSGLNAARDAYPGAEPRFVGNEHRIATEHRDLLSNGSVADTLARLLQDRAPELD
ncbi:hypothetical protein [Streptomyces malaysiensis]|uniref:Uncharacterized protein n=1 Tax=Streptomyces malaysiensis subsp. samsunensis TaxID=459658 RepID=A0A9X2M600_STRMQ|nr:hypothetical protein [Streptomyces samsunensis]MCQ8835688.1 hypothetical protein [Streptomyces samsunensis]